MQSTDDYIRNLPADRQEPIRKLRGVLRENLPKGFQETLQYGMISFVVPHSIYPAGYHCKPEDALPFASVASQKNHIALYHSGLYSDESLKAWWEDAYAEQVPTKLDMGKSCVRFKNPANIPYDLIGELAQKVSVKDWITRYEDVIKR